MYPYKEEILSSLQAFAYAWLLILMPIALIAGIHHVSTYGSNKTRTA